jgi:hypothetical protein
MTTALIFATLSLLANLFYVGIFIMLNFSATEYSPVYNAVSDYAVGKHSSIFASVYGPVLSVCWR